MAGAQAAMSKDASIHFEEIGEADADRLVDWLPRHAWPYHARPRVDADWVRDSVASGGFFGPDAKAFWCVGSDGNPLGIARVFDLSDVTPLIDLRVANDARGQGVGTAALR